jgi:hypothetical protein
VLLGSNFSDAYGKPKGAGTNIEGIAIIGDRLYAGLRTPTGSSEAFIVSAPVKPAAGAAKKLLATVTTSTIGGDGKPAKAETVTVLDEAADRLKLLVLYDNINEGEPTQYDISLRP